jgi:hypothetical protein
MMLRRGRRSISAIAARGIRHLVVQHPIVNFVILSQSRTAA